MQLQVASRRSTRDRANVVWVQGGGLARRIRWRLRKPNLPDPPKSKLAAAPQDPDLSKSPKSKPAGKLKTWSCKRLPSPAFPQTPKSRFARDPKTQTCRTPKSASGGDPQIKTWAKPPNPDLPEISKSRNAGDLKSLRCASTSPDNNDPAADRVEDVVEDVHPDPFFAMFFWRTLIFKKKYLFLKFSFWKSTSSTKNVANHGSESTSSTTSSTCFLRTAPSVRQNGYLPHCLQ